MQRLNPGNNSLRKIPIKETVALPLEQFYLTTELSNVVGTSFIFVTSFGRYPCLGGNLFSSGKLTAHRHGTLFCTKISFWYAHNATAALEYRLSVDSQTIQRSVSALSAAWFCSQQTRFRLLYIAFDPLLGSPYERRYCDPNSLGHIVLRFPHSKDFIFNSSFINIKYILTPCGRTKTKLADNKRKSTHPSRDGC